MEKHVYFSNQKVTIENQKIVDQKAIKESNLKSNNKIEKILKWHIEP